MLRARLLKEVIVEERGPACKEPRGDILARSCKGKGEAEECAGTQEGGSSGTAARGAQSVRLRVSGETGEGQGTRPERTATAGSFGISYTCTLQNPHERLQGRAPFSGPVIGKPCCERQHTATRSR